MEVEVLEKVGFAEREGFSSYVGFAPVEGPIVTALDPDNKGQGLNTWVTITGSGFTGATAVSFGAGITTSGLTVDSDTQIRIYIRIDARTPVGMRDVSVTTPIGTGTLEDGFEVTLTIWGLHQLVAATPSAGLTRIGADYEVAHDFATASWLGSWTYIGQRDDYNVPYPFAIYRPAMYFSIAGYIPSDAILYSITLKLWVADDQSDTDFDIVVVDPSDVDDVAAVKANYGDLLDEVTSYGSINSSALVAGQYNDLEVSSGLFSKIDVTDTYIRMALRSSRDISKTEPTGREYIAFSNLTNQKVRCFIRWTLPTS